MNAAQRKLVNRVRRTVMEEIDRRRTLEPMRLIRRQAALNELRGALERATEAELLGPEPEGGEW